MLPREKQNPHYIIPLFTGIGNAILTIPLIRTLKHHHQGSRITLVCPKGPITQLFEQDPDVDLIVHRHQEIQGNIYLHTLLGGDKKMALWYRLRKPQTHFIAQSFIGYPHSLKDRIFNWLMGAQDAPCNPAEHEIDYYLSFLSALGIPWPTDKTITLHTATSAIPLPIKPYCVIQASTTNQQESPKMWPANHWKTVIQLLSEDIPIYLVGSATERQWLDQLVPQSSRYAVENLAGKTTIPDTVHLVKQAHFFLGNDSGIGHIAGALNTNTLILWGSTYFEKSHQIGKNTHFITLDLPCSPCQGPERLGLYTGPDALAKCQYNVKCTRGISPERVMKKLATLGWIPSIVR